MPTHHVQTTIDFVEAAFMRALQWHRKPDTCRLILGGSGGELGDFFRRVFPALSFFIDRRRREKERENESFVNTQKKESDERENVIVNAYPDLARRGRRASRDDASSAPTLPSPTASSLQDRRPRMKSSLTA